MVQTNTKTAERKVSSLKKAYLEHISKYPDYYLNPANGVENTLRETRELFPKLEYRELREPVEDLVYTARLAQEKKSVNGLAQKLKEIDFLSLSKEVAGLYHIKQHPLSDKYGQLMMDALKDKESLEVLDKIASETGTAPDVLRIVFTRLSEGKPLEVGECYRASSLLRKVSFS